MNALAVAVLSVFASTLFIRSISVQGMRGVACGVTNECETKVLAQVNGKWAIEPCPGQTRIDHVTMVDCLQTSLRTSASSLSASLGYICCNFLSHVTPLCRAACLSALYSVTMSAAEQVHRIRIFCQFSPHQSDKETFQCVATDLILQTAQSTKTQSTKTQYKTDEVIKMCICPRIFRKLPTLETFSEIRNTQSHLPE